MCPLHVVPELLLMEGVDMAVRPSADRMDEGQPDGESGALSNRPVRPTHDLDDWRVADSQTSQQETSLVSDDEPRMQPGADSGLDPGSGERSGRDEGDSELSATCDTQRAGVDKKRKGHTCALPDIARTIAKQKERRCSQRILQGASEGTKRTLLKESAHTAV